MNFYSAETLADSLAWNELVPAVAEAFRRPPEVPLRGHYDIDPEHPGKITLLTMPAWKAGEYIGVKLVNVAPENQKRALPTVLGSYVLMSAETGEPLAIIDAPELTARRTAATSALAADKLARKSARTHLVVGAGTLAPYMVEAVRSVRPVQTTLVWARKAEQAQSVAEKTGAGVATDLREAVSQADIISCVTTATRPVIHGAWLSPGTHLDLVGAFRADMREVDDEAVINSSIFVDTMEGALHEAGELRDPIARGIISAKDVRSDLAGLVKGIHHGRTDDREITLFKSVGSAIGDYAAARCLLG